MATGKKSASKKADQIKKKTTEVPVEFVVPPDIEILYSDGLFINFSFGSFILSFVQTNHPLLVSDEDAHTVKKVESICVARIAFTPERMHAALEVLNKQYRNFILSQQSSESREA